jgi:glutamate synthase (NADPH/NADH) large chain
MMEDAAPPGQRPPAAGYQQWLLDEERDSCALVVNMRKGGASSHGNVKRTLEALLKMGHRTGEVDGEGDGCGLMTDIPRQLWADCLEAQERPGALSLDKRFFVAHIMIPMAHRAGATAIQERLRQMVAQENCLLLCEQTGNVRSQALGKLGRRDEPLFWQVAGIVQSGPLAQVDRRLFDLLVRMETESPVHVVSLSAHTVVYKLRGAVESLGQYYPELRNPEFQSSVTIGHSRYSTNTLSIFPRVQPFSILAHNGEINTIAKLRQEALMLGAVLVQSGSDSQDLDRVLQTLICHHGFDLMEAMEIIFPPILHEVDRLPAATQAVYRHYRRAFGPFSQGPAAILARYGDVCVFSVDALGLRPLWFGETDKEYFFSSEKGVIPLEMMNSDPRPLAPGEKMAALVRPGKAPEILTYDRIRAWVTVQGEKRLAPLPQSRSSWSGPQIIAPLSSRPADGAARQRRVVAMGWSREDLELLDHTARTGAELIGSLGYDGPLAALARTGQNLADYFKESVAVVTNPAIDREREMEHFSLQAVVGPRPDLAASPAAAPVELAIPVLMGGHRNSPPLGPDAYRTLARRHGAMLLEDLLTSWDMLMESGAIARLDMAAETGETLEEAAARLRRQAVAAVQGGASLIVLDDQTAVDGARLWLDPVLAVAAVDGALRHQPGTGSAIALRRRTGLVVRTAGVRNLHDLALVLGMGADAVAPYLLWEVAAGEAPASLAETESRMQHALGALTKGLEKVISTMGIHELRGYGRLFAAIGLSTPLAEAMEARNYYGSASRGLTWQDLEAESARRAALLRGQDAVEPQRVRRFYPSVWKKAAEAALDPERYADYGAAVAALEATNPVSARHLLDLRLGERASSPPPGGASIQEHSLPIFISAMSFGSQGETAFRAYAEAAKRLNIVCLNGEGGEIPDMVGRYSHWRGQQIASGRFGVSATLLNSTLLLEIKIGQGAKPGEGGHLPGRKVSAKVAAARHTNPGTELISPSNNHDLYSIEDLAELVEELKTVNPWARVSVKVPVVPGIGVVAVGIAKAGADIINLSGYDGGTGAARRHATRHVGLPTEIGVMEAHRALSAAGLRRRVEVWCEGGMKTAADVVKMICLGANRVGFGTLAMIAVGCTVCRRCHQDMCHAGIATQVETAEEAARLGIRNFHPLDLETSTRRLANLFGALGSEVAALTADLGAARTQDLLGQTHLLTQARGMDLLDLDDLLAVAPAGNANGILASRTLRRPRNTLTQIITRMVDDALADGDRSVRFFDDHVSATDRALGTHLSGALARQRLFGDAETMSKERGLCAPPANLRTAPARHASAELETADLLFDAGSVGGNGAGAFMVEPLRMVIEGGAQDGAAKGAFGGRLATLKGMNQLGQWVDGAVGKGFAYGAMGGLFLVQGNADSRFCVRLSGADVVAAGDIEQPLDDKAGFLATRANLKGFAFEYMTAGRAVVLGDPGPWMCAGMTGGVIYQRLQPSLGMDLAALRRRIARGARVQIGRLDAADEAALGGLLAIYAEELRIAYQPAEAERILALAAAPSGFVKIVPAGGLGGQSEVTD